MKIKKYRHNYSSQFIASTHAFTSKIHKSMKSIKKWMGPKQWCPTMCLQPAHQISHSSKTIWEFHTIYTNMCHTSLHNEPTEKKNINQIENAIEKSRKIHMLS